MAEATQGEWKFIKFKNAVFFLRSQSGVLIASEQNSESDIFSAGLDLLEGIGEIPLEYFTYQARGASKTDSSQMRQRLSLIRAEAGNRLGAMVVSDNTVFFHGNTFGFDTWERPARLQFFFSGIDFQNFTGKSDGKLISINKFKEMEELKNKISQCFSGYHIVGNTNKETNEIVGLSENGYFVLQNLAHKKNNIFYFEIGDSMNSNTEELMRLSKLMISMLSPQLVEACALRVGGVSMLAKLCGRSWVGRPMGKNHVLAVLDLENIQEIAVHI